MAFDDNGMHISTIPLILAEARGNSNFQIDYVGDSGTGDPKMRMYMHNIGTNAVMDVMKAFDNGTSGATAGLAAGTITSAKAAQLVQSGTATIPPLSITEIATVVNPGDIPASRVPFGHTTNANFRTRKPPPSTSRMSDDTADGAQ